MSVVKSTLEFREAIMHGDFINGEPACMQLAFGGTPEDLWVEVRVVRKRDGLPLAEVARVHGLQPGTTVTLEDIANAFNIKMTYA